MAHQSKKARKKRNARNGSLQTRLRQLEARNAGLVDAAVSAHDESAHLAKILCVLLASTDGTISIPESLIASLPKDVSLQEYYDPNTDAIVLRAARPKSALIGVDGAQLTLPIGADAPEEPASPLALVPA